MTPEQAKEVLRKLQDYCIGTHITYRDIDALTFATAKIDECAKKDEEMARLKKQLIDKAVEG